MNPTPGRDSQPTGVSDHANYEKLRQTARTEVAQRLRPVCDGWSESDFQTLVDDAVSIALRYPSPWWELEKEKTYGH